MANSRLERLGTIFSRVTSLMKCGALKDVDKPLWYEVYQVFPPIDDPSFARRTSMAEIKPILYPEDKIRAKFHQGVYQRSYTVENLESGTTNDITRRVISMTYTILENDKTMTEDEALKKAITQLRDENILKAKRTTMFRPRSKMGDKTFPSTSAAVFKEIETDDVKNIAQKDIDVTANISKAADTEKSNEVMYNSHSIAETFKKAVDDASKQKNEGGGTSSEK